MPDDRQGTTEEGAAPEDAGDQATLRSRLAQHAIRNEQPHPGDEPRRAITPHHDRQPGASPQPGPWQQPGTWPSNAWQQPRAWPAGTWQQPAASAWPQPGMWQPPGTWHQPGTWQQPAAPAWPAAVPPWNPWVGPGMQFGPYSAWNSYWPGMWPVGSVPWGQARPPAVLPVLEPPGNFHPPVDRPVLSLKGRASPRLYGFGLVMGLPAIAVLLMYMVAAGAGFKPSTDPVPRWLWLEGLCLAAAAGLIGWAVAQARQRRADGWLDYSGPSPLLMLGALLAIVTAMEVPLKAALDGLKIDIESGLATLLVVLVFLATYVGLVHFVAVRSRALTWHDIARPEGLAPSPDDWSAAAPIAGWSRRAGETVRAWRSRNSGGRLGDLLVPLAMCVPLIIVTNVAVRAMLLVLGLSDSDIASFRTSGPITGADRVLLFVAVAILTPIGEEIFFRGFATNAWGRSLSRSSTIVRGSLVFAFVHVLNTSTTDVGVFWRVAVLNFGARVPVAFVLTWLYMRRRSILASGTLHACYNGLLLIIAFL